MFDHRRLSPSPGGEAQFSVHTSIAPQGRARNEFLFIFDASTISRVFAVRYAECQENWQGDPIGDLSEVTICLNLSLRCQKLKIDDDLADFLSI
jgi:hypothetical protein